MTGASHMLMRGETLPYTPNFSFRRFLDFEGLPACIMLNITRMIGGEIKITSTGYETRDWSVLV